MPPVRAGIQAQSYLIGFIPRCPATRCVRPAALIVPVISLRSRSFWCAALALAAGAALRLWFIHSYPVVEGDTFIYGDIAKNWMQHGIYGLSADGIIRPTLIRLPGYALFLVLCFKLFGTEHYNAVMYFQTAIDLATCVLIAAFACRIWNRRAGWWALWLAALCPFTANYAAAPMAEVPELFCIALGFYVLVRILEAPRWSWAVALAFAWSYAALLRPDGALLAVALCPALVIYGGRRWGAIRMVQWAALAAVLSILPFVAWTVRNERTFHVFQPLAPRYAVDPGESANRGFVRWVRSLCVDLTCTSDVYWNANDDVIDLNKLPARAFDSPAHYEQTKQLITEYNRITTITPQLDAAFGALAAQRVHDHPFRYFIGLPLARLADMWLRPRTENLWIELRWWEFRHHPAETEFSCAYAALNLAYLIAALIGYLRKPPYRGAILAFVLLRCALLLTLESSEPRYTLECFPPLIALAAIALSGGVVRTPANLPEQAAEAVP